MRKGDHKKASWAYLGAIIIIIAASMAVATLAAIILGDHEHVTSFLLPTIFALAVGAILYRPYFGQKLPSLTIRDAMSIVVAGWLCAFLISAWPFVLGGILSYRLALFEAISGWTTTGLSVINEAEVPHVYLFWRSFMQFLGGAGFAIAMLASVLGTTGAGLSHAEGRQEIMPMVKRSASIIGLIYLAYAGTFTVIYWILGMSPFDAVNHSMAVLSTGGFSTNPESIAAWPTLPIEAATIIMMIIGNTDFRTHHKLLRGKWREAWDNPEFKTMLAFSLAIILFLILLPTFGATYNLREAVFQVISALSTTGYGTVDLSRWTGPALAALILLMSIGGGVNSTAGGMKQRRIYLIYKSISWHLREAVLPRTAVVSHTIKEDGRVTEIDDGEIREVGNFLLLYIFTLFAASLGIASFGYPFTDAFFEAASALGTVGLSVGITSPTAPPAVLWIEKVCMFLGRLEFFAILIAVKKWLDALDERIPRS